MSVNKIDKEKLAQLLKPTIAKPRRNLLVKIKIFLRAYLHYFYLRIKFRKKINNQLKVLKYLKQGLTALRWMYDQLPNKEAKKQFVRDACKQGFVHNKWVEYFELRIINYEKYLRQMRRRGFKSKKKVEKKAPKGYNPPPQPPEKECSGDCESCKHKENKDGQDNK